MSLIHRIIDLTAMGITVTISPAYNPKNIRVNLQESARSHKFVGADIPKETIDNTEFPERVVCMYMNQLLAELRPNLIKCKPTKTK